MMDCLFVAIDGGVQCVRCGRRVRTKSKPEKVRANCAAIAPYGVGDAIAWFTGWTGLAAWWYKKTAPKGGCGCAKRQRSLNLALPFPARVRGLMALTFVWWRSNPRRQSPPERTDRL